MYVCLSVCMSVCLSERIYACIFVMQVYMSVLSISPIKELRIARRREERFIASVLPQLPFAFSSHFPAINKQLNK